MATCDRVYRRSEDESYRWRAVVLSGMACVGIRTYAFMYVFELCNWMERLGAAT